MSEMHAIGSMVGHILSPDCPMVVLYHHESRNTVSGMPECICRYVNNRGEYVLASFHPCELTVWVDDDDETTGVGFPGLLDAIRRAGFCPMVEPRREASEGSIRYGVAHESSPRKLTYGPVPCVEDCTHEPGEDGQVVVSIQGNDVCITHHWCSAHGWEPVEAEQHATA